MRVGMMARGRIRFCETAGMSHTQGARRQVKRAILRYINEFYTLRRRRRSSSGVRSLSAFDPTYELQPLFDALIADLKRSTKLFMPSRQIATQSPAG